MTPPPPPWGGDRPDKRGEIARGGGGTCVIYSLHICWGYSVCANAVGFGILPGGFELLVQCAKILFPWGGGILALSG